MNVFPYDMPVEVQEEIAFELINAALREMVETDE